jgi:hypothetical protein
LAPFDRLPDVSEIAPPQKAPFYKFLPTTIRARALAIRASRRMVTLKLNRRAEPAIKTQPKPTPGLNG